MAFAYQTFVAVGMRFHGDHKFSDSDKITIKCVDDCPFDKNAVAILVDGKQVAFVSRDTTDTARKAIAKGMNRAVLVKSFPRSAWLQPL